MTAFRSRAALAALALALGTGGAPAQPPAPAKAAADENSVLLETVGLVVGLQLYQAYLNIGLIADARAAGLYEAAEAAQLLGSVVGPLEKVEKQLEKVAALKLTREDAAALAGMKKIAGLLRQQGKSLQSHWDTGAEEHGKKYEEARRAAWKELSALLDLEPKKGVAPAPKPVEKKPSLGIPGIRPAASDTSPPLRLIAPPDPFCGSRRVLP